MPSVCPLRYLSISHRHAWSSLHVLSDYPKLKIRPQNKGGLDGLPRSSLSKEGYFPK
jgi:hypothetical protein